MKKRIPIRIRRLLSSGQVVTVVVVRNIDDGLYVKDCPGFGDVVEWRIDEICTPEIVSIMRYLKKIGKPIILTPRSRYEGGRQLWTFAERKVIFRKYMRLAAFIDIEANDAAFFTDIIEEARAMGVVIILSYHSLGKYPAMKEVEFAFQNFKSFKGNIFKVAIYIETNEQMAEFSRYVAELNEAFPNAIAAMGTGLPFGRQSRKEFANEKWTVLVYCFATGAAPVNGQYQIVEFITDVLGHTVEY